MTSGSKQDSPVFPRSAGGKWRLLASDTMWGKLRGLDDGKQYTLCVWFSVIVTIRFTSHRVGTGVQKTTTPPARHHEANQVSRVQERWGVREMQGVGTATGHV